MPRISNDPQGAALNLGRAIKVARVKKGWKQKELAKAMDVSPTYISLLERDQRDPSWRFVVKLAAVLEVPLPLLILLASDEADQRGAQGSLRNVLAHELLGLLAETRK